MQKYVALTGDAQLHPPCALARVGISALPTNPKSIQNMDFIRPPCSAISNGILTPYSKSLYHNSRLTATTFRQRLYLKSQAGLGSGVTKSARLAKASGAQTTCLGRRPVQRQAGPPEGGRYEECYGRTLAMRVTAQSISSRWMTRGGAMRMMVSWVSLQRRPSFLRASQ
jgi:hypothetical protein